MGPPQPTRNLAPRLIATREKGAASLPAKDKRRVSSGQLPLKERPFAFASMDPKNVRRRIAVSFTSAVCRIQPQVRPGGSAFVHKGTPH